MNQIYHKAAPQFSARLTSSSPDVGFRFINQATSYPVSLASKDLS